jgi:hypothetical protein
MEYILSMEWTVIFHPEYSKWFEAIEDQARFDEHLEELAAAKRKIEEARKQALKKKGSKK